MRNAYCDCTCSNCSDCTGQELPNVREHPPCACCGSYEQRPGAITFENCAGWEDDTPGHTKIGHVQV